LITNNDEAAYREEVRDLGVWCQEINLSLNVNITGADRGLQETAEGEPPLPTTMGQEWRRWKASSSSMYISLTN
jgi:hypothetical protein